MDNTYSIDNIQHLETREAMRQKIPMYLGSDDTDGIYQAFKEIINNSTDEALAGYGNKILIQLDEASNGITIRDYGRGVPWGIKDGRNILVAIYTESHTGGKFDKGSYKNSSGLNGIGGTAVCMSSLCFNVESCRDGKMAVAEFEKGILKNYNEYNEKEWIKVSGHKFDGTGTTISFIPDKEVFKNMEEGYSYDRICREIKNIAYLNKGIHFIVETTSGKKTEFYSKNGIADFIADIAKKPLMKEPIIVSKTDGIDEIEIAFMWTADEYQEYVFVNGLYCPEGGSPITGAKTTITTTIKRLAKKDFAPDVIRRGLVYAINCKVANPSFANQTKSKVNNPSLRTLASQAFKEGLEQFGNSSEFAAIIERINQVAKAEAAAEREYQKTLNADKEIEKEIKKKSIMANKLKDCRIHDSESVLYITEGDSALGSFVQARDSTRVAAMPIRGKIINAMKNPIEDVLDNEEVKDIAKACGCGILDKVNLAKLRYGKVCFAADADPDGYSIVCLLLVLFYKLMPELIKAGKIYWAQFPLYEITVGKQTFLAYDDAEAAPILKKYPKATLSRNKGLGEMDADIFAEAAFGPEARLVQFTMKDAEAAEQMLETLLGNRNAERTDYIFSNVDFSTVEGE